MSSGSNTTIAKGLLDQQIAAINALRYAISTVQAAAPNARDYQSAPADAFASAMSQHRTRIIHLETVLRELDQTAEFISNQAETEPRFRRS